MKKELEEVGFEAAIPQLPGFAQAEAPKRPWSVSDYVNWVKTRLPKEYFLVGHSFGGRIAIKLASQDPKGLGGLILINSAGIKPRRTLKHLLFLVLAKMGRLIFLLPPFFIFKNFARKALYKLAGVRDYYRAKGVMKETLKKVISEDLKGDLKKIKVPTLILWGEKDRTTPLSDGELMNRLIPHSSLKVFPEADHSLPLKFPKQTSLAIIKFARSV